MNQGSTATETSTSTPLDRLYQLQEILLEVRRKTERRDTTPDHLLHVEAAYHETLKQKEEVGGRLSKATSRRKELEGEIADLGERLKKYQSQLSAVKTNKEYGALLNEMDGVKREIRTREDEILSLEESLAELKTESAAHDTNFPGEAEGYEEEMKEWRAEQTALSQQIEQAQSLIGELRQSIEKRLLAMFDRIAGARAGVAVAKVQMVAAQTAACSACNVRLRPQLLADVRMSRDTVYCESCKRILYWDERTVRL